MSCSFTWNYVIEHFQHSVPSSPSDWSKWFTLHWQLITSLWQQVDLSGKHSAMLQLNGARRLVAHIFPLVSISRCSFIQPSKPRHPRGNENSKASKQQQRGLKRQSAPDRQSGVLPLVLCQLEEKKNQDKVWHETSQSNYSKRTNKTHWPCSNDQYFA